MADRLVKYWGDGCSWEDRFDPQALHEAKLLKMNCDKARAGLNWQSVLTIDEGMQMTAHWYKIFYTVPLCDSMYKICTQQIANYVESARKRKLFWTEGTDFKFGRRYTGV
jgi:CDP-glucose 4,6-dehydratase